MSETESTQAQRDNAAYCMNKYAANVSAAPSGAARPGEPSAWAAYEHAAILCESLLPSEPLRSAVDVCRAHPGEEAGKPSERDVLLKVCAAYGGNPEEECWHTPEGVAAIIEEVSGQARANFVRGWNAKGRASVEAPDAASGEREPVDSDPAETYIGHGDLVNTLMMLARTGPHSGFGDDHLWLPEQRVAILGVMNLIEHLHPSERASMRPAIAALHSTGAAPEDRE